MPPLSRIRCFKPFFFASIPAARPAGPAPITMTSNDCLLITLPRFQIISFCDDVRCGCQLQPAILLPLDNQRAGLRAHRYLPLGFSGQNRCYGSSARTGSRGVGVADAALPESNFDLAPVQHSNELDIRSIRESSMVFK